MHEPNLDRQHPVVGDEKSLVPRRRFLKGVTTAIGGIVVWRASDALLGAQAAAQTALPAVAAGYPKPNYVPGNYRLQEVYTSRPDGFGRTADGIAYWYANLTYPLGSHHPLAIYVTPHPQHPSLVPNRKGEPVVLSMTSGGYAQAEYHDGFWTLSLEKSGPDGPGEIVWETSNAHSLSFRWKQYAIGVRGARLTGVDRNELIRVAAAVG